MTEKGGNRMLRRLKLALFGAALLLAAGNARAACLNPAMPDGSVFYNADQNVPQLCASGSWISLGQLNPGAGSGVCTDPAMPEGSIFYNDSHDVLQYCDGEYWRTLGGGSGGGGGGGACGVFPYAFAPGPPTPLGAQATSNIVQITTDSCSPNIQISGSGAPQFRICADAGCGTVAHDWGSSAQSIDTGEYLQVRLNAPGTDGAFSTATVNIGGALNNWSVEGVGPHKKIFITSTTHSGNMTGVTGANGHCAARATAAGLSGTFYAWIADNNTSSAPATRFTQASVPYRRVDLVKVANNWADLIDGSLAANLNIDEAGNPVAPDGTVGSDPVVSFFSNVTSSGTRKGTSNHCTNWTTNAFGNTAHTGDALSTNGGWSDRTTFFQCAMSRLLCVEQ